MPRILILTLCLLFSGLIFGCENSASAPSQKIGLVNINRILVDSEPGRQAAKYMENLQDKLREEASELQKKAQKLAEKENSDKDKDINEEEEEKLQREIQMGYVRLQTKLQAEQQNVNSILNDVVHRVVEKYRRDNGYALIIFSDVVLSFDEQTDVTSNITQVMNQEKVEFKPLPEGTPENQAPEEKKETTQDNAQATNQPNDSNSTKTDAPKTDNNKSK